MRSFSVLTEALDFIEEHLTAPFTLEELAAVCHYSLSGLHKLFRYAFGCSIKEYLSKRRLCHAAFDLVHSKDTVTEVAYRYQYSAAPFSGSGATRPPASARPTDSHNSIAGFYRPHKEGTRL